MGNCFSCDFWKPSERSIDDCTGRCKYHSKHGSRTESHDGCRNWSLASHYGPEKKSATGTVTPHCRFETTLA
ncbi:hypothetical protein KAR91_18255 [Candidatus Pacearchaeota archaeon]|nr:hypothetical protein [Candidatus Pacearchaeota archaeon]